METDIFGKAILDYQKGNYSEDICTQSSLNEEDKIPIPYLFRAYDGMPKLEQLALGLCKGKVLDIGAGAGSHSLYLQQQKITVTALDTSPGAIETCKLRGVKHLILGDIYSYSGQKYDTLLLLMNGIGLAKKLKNITAFLMHLKSLLNPGGQILVDSSDIIYMFEADEDGGYWIPDTQDYYGEVVFSLHYKGEKSADFSWLYLDFNTLNRAAAGCGFYCELVSNGEHYDYLARLEVSE